MQFSYTQFAPASIGNFIAGFDVLGLAIAPVNGAVLGDTVSVAADEITRLKVSGNYADWVPQQGSNLVFQAARRIQGWLRQHDLPEWQFMLHLEKNLPVGSGTGSSAASAAAAVQAICGYLNEYQEIAVPMADRWEIMGELEGGVSGGNHLDNLAPAVLGGLVLCPQRGLPQQLPFFDDWYIVMAYNGQQLLTREARACLPAQYPRATTIAQLQRMAALVDGLHRQDPQRVLDHLHDELAEPYRAELIEDYLQCKKALLQQGALAVGISGAGPSFFALSDSLQQAELLADWLRSNLHMHPGGFVHICQSWYP